MCKIASYVAKKVINTGLNNITGANQDQPLDANLNGHLSGTPSKGLVSKVVHFVHKGSVIDAQSVNGGETELHKMLAKQLNANDGKPMEPLDEGENDGVKGDKPKVEVRTITLEDFKKMVGEKKGGLGKVNKGYVRFAKANDGGLKLEKVGNKCGIFINSRINVTAEHNREMRMLFADKLLADWGGSDFNENDFSKYGSKIVNQLKGIKSGIMGTNDKETGKLLSRKEIAASLESYEKLFTDAKNLKDIRETFLSECYGKLNYSVHGQNQPKLSVFMSKYGKYADEGYRTQEQLEDKLRACADPASLRKEMDKIIDQFAKMGKAWGVDRQNEVVVDSVLQSLTSGCKTLNADQSNALQDFLLNKLGANKDFAKDPDMLARAVQKFATKILPAFANSVRSQFIVETSKTADAGKKAELAEAFKAKLTLEAIVKEADDFIAAFREYEASGKGKDPMESVKELLTAAKDHIKAKLDERLQKNPDVSDTEFQAELDNAEKDLARIKDQLDYLDNPQKVIDAKLDEIREKNGDKFVFRDTEDKKADGWTKEELGDIIRQGAKDAPNEFAEELFLNRYTAERYTTDGMSGQEKVARGYWGDKCQKVLENVLQKFGDKLDKALNINLVSKDDISLNDYCSYMADVLLGSTVRGDMATKSFELNTGKRIGTVEITVERLIEAFVKKAVAAKVEQGTSYAEMARNMTDKLNTLLDKLHKHVADFNAKNTGVIKRFYTGVRGYSRISAISEDTLHAESDASVKEAEHAVQINMLKSFLENDLFNLLDSTDEAEFAKDLDDRLTMRQQEAVSASVEADIKGFYEGALNFRTGQVQDGERKQESINGTTYVDPKTGFENPGRVETSYVGLVKDYDFQGKIDQHNEKMSYHPIPPDQLKGHLAARAETLWRDEVVNHAPGRSRSDTIDWVVYKFKKTFNIDRTKQPDDDWCKARVKGATAKLDKTIKTYFSFETKFVNLCRARVEKALLATKDDKIVKSLDSMNDPLARAQFLDDILAGFQSEMASVLERFIKTPSAFDRLQKDPARFARFVDDTLGLTQRGEVDLEATDGFKNLKGAANRVIEQHQVLLDAWMHRKDEGPADKLAQDVAFVILSLLENPSLPKDQVFLKKCKGDLTLLHTVFNPMLKQLSEEALKHPLDFYPKDFKPKAGENPMSHQNVFLQGLAKTFIADMAKRCAKISVETLENVLKELGEIVEEIPEIKGSTALYEFATTERFATLQHVVTIYAEKNTTRRDEAIVALKNHFKETIQKAVKAQGIEVGEAFSKLRGAYHGILSDCESTLREKDLTPGALLSFRQEANKIFTDKYNKEVETIQKTSYLSAADKQNRIAECAIAIRSEIEDLTDRLVKKLQDRHALFSEQRKIDFLTAMGLDCEAMNAKDPDAFKEMIEEFDQMWKENDLDDAVEILQMSTIADLNNPEGDNRTLCDVISKTVSRETLTEIYDKAVIKHVKGELLSLASEDLQTAGEVAKLSADDLKGAQRKIDQAVDERVKQATKDGVDIQTLRDQPLPGLAEIITTVLKSGDNGKLEPHPQTDESGHPVADPGKKEQAPVEQVKPTSIGDVKQAPVGQVNKTQAVDPIQQKISNAATAFQNTLIQEIVEASLFERGIFGIENKKYKVAFPNLQERWEMHYTPSAIVKQYYVKCEKMSEDAYKTNGDAQLLIATGNRFMNLAVKSFTEEYKLKLKQNSGITEDALEKIKKNARNVMRNAKVDDTATAPKMKYGAFIEKLHDMVKALTREYENEVKNSSKK